MWVFHLLKFPLRFFIRCLVLSSQKKDFAQPPRKLRTWKFISVSAPKKRKIKHFCLLASADDITQTIKLMNEIIDLVNEQKSRTRRVQGVSMKGCQKFFESVLRPQRNAKGKLAARGFFWLDSPTFFQAPLQYWQIDFPLPFLA